MKKYWWKILCVLLLGYALVFGLLTPLNPGLPSIYPISGKVNTNVVLNIQGYNTQFNQADQNRVWLKLGDKSMIARQTAATNTNLLKATFDIPSHLPSGDSVVVFSLVVDNNLDGAMVLPNALFIKQQELNLPLANKLWKNTPIEGLNKFTGLTFPYRNILGETIRNLYFHVSLWFAMFTLLAVSVFFSIKYLYKSDLRDDYRANSLILVGVVFGLLGCATGSIWAKYTWGTWWTTDVKLNMSAVFMLIYLAYFVLRGSFQDEIKRARLGSVYSIFAFSTLIPLLFVIPRLVDSLHPGNGGNPGFGGEDLDNSMRMVFYPAIIGMILLGFWMSDLKFRIDWIRERLLA